LCLEPESIIITNTRHVKVHNYGTLKEISDIFSDNSPHGGNDDFKQLVDNLQEVEVYAAPEVCVFKRYMYEELSKLVTKPALEKKFPKWLAKENKKYGDKMDWFAADVYSLCCVLVEVLSGLALFGNTSSKLQKITAGKIRNFVSGAPLIPPELHQVELGDAMVNHEIIQVLEQGLSSAPSTRVDIETLRETFINAQQILQEKQ
jgi:hypothetical protein